ncbi:sugar-transfer associated ATP-grasp domain-containing protein [Paenibacillus sp.]
MKQKTFKAIMSRMKFFVKFPILFVRIRKVIAMPTYYPELTRKSTLERWKDNIVWLIRNKEVNYLYTGYGLDVKDFRDPEDFVAHREFCYQRNSGVKKKRSFYGNPYNDVVLLRDKYVFASYIESTIGASAIPATLGLIDHGEVFLHQKREWVSINHFCQNDSCFVMKDIDGTYGDGVKLVTVENGKFVYDGESHSADAFAKSCGTKRFLLQELIVQHDALLAFKTRCVNTVRAITVRGKSGKIELFAAFLRVGNDNETFVDNRAKGGLAVGVEPDTGRLMKYGFPHEEFGTKVTIHPMSGISFEGYQLPYWQETLDLIINAHRQFPDIGTIGWDVTITADGPIIVEANDGWEISGPQDTHGGLKERWNRLRNQ